MHRLSFLAVSLCSIWAVVLATFDDFFAGTSSADGSSTTVMQQQETNPKNDPFSYGVDVSFPIHHDHIDIHAKGPFSTAQRMDYYDSFMKGCREKMYPLEYLCDKSERNRIQSNLMQPSKMKNYTTLGFQKVTTPPKLHKLLSKFWLSNAKGSTNIHAEGSYKEEKWDKYYGQYTTSSTMTYMNHWKSYTQLIDIEDPYLYHSGEEMRAMIRDETKVILEQWAGTELSPSAMYGVRLWARESVITPHVDMEPFVISAIIHVAEMLDKPWIMELIGHDGRAYNMTLLPGEMLIYEGGSVIHGRPFPMEGDFFADLYLHFEPYLSQPSQSSSKDEDLGRLYEETLSTVKRSAKVDENKLSHMTNATIIPHYIKGGSLLADRWRQSHPRTKLRITVDSLTINAHTAASIGDLEALKLLADNDPASIQHVDDNGWTPLHEAVRGDNLEIIKYLLSKGLDINHRTHHGDGGSPLWWAKHHHGKNHRVVKFLESRGAKDIPPDDSE